MFCAWRQPNWASLIRRCGPLHSVSLAGLGLIAIACGLTAPSNSGHDRLSVGASPRLAVPAYVFGPGPTYQQLAQNVPAVGIVVANVDSGPGPSPSSDWAVAIEVAHRAGAAVLAYVDTGYIGTTYQTTRPPARSSASAAWRDQIHRDVDTWYRHYGSTLDGVFFDQVTAACGATSGDHTWIDFYIDLSRYVRDRHPKARVALNPGQVPDQCYARAADTIVTFEGSYSTYLEQDLARTNPAWIRKLAPARSWHLVYGVRKVEVGDVIARARAANAGYVYATSLTLPNPWASLPADDYWNEELIRATGTADTRAPTIPRHVRIVSASSDRLVIAWDGSLDDVAVAAYDVTLNGTVVATVHGTQAALAGLAPGARYLITVRARDPAGNTSAAGKLEITTPYPEATPAS